MRDSTGYFRVLETDKDHPFNMAFYCPACKCNHGLNTDKSRRPHWEIFTSDGKVSVSPSILLRIPTEKGMNICHLYIRKGQIEYLTDCTHEMAGKSVPLELEEE